MDLKQRKSAFVQLGVILKHLGAGEPWPGYVCGINEAEYTQLFQLVEDLQYRNAWFTPQNVRKALFAWGNNLTDNNLNEWLGRYPQEILANTKIKTVGLVLAGNIPMVGFHDVLSVLISGHRALIRYSSDDNVLLPALLKTLFTLSPDFEERCIIATGKLSGMDAVIATGSNNTGRYFEQYFGSLPHIFRGNRNSLALVHENASEADLKAIGNDIFDFFGLGCRNVTQVLFPRNFELDRFFTAIYDFHHIINHHKYANNYDYYKALYLLNREDLLDNGFLLLRQHTALHSTLGTLHFQYYDSPEAARLWIDQNQQGIQCVVDTSQTLHNAVAPGQSQQPQLWDYADGVDTLDFLLKLKN